MGPEVTGWGWQNGLATMEDNQPPRKFGFRVEDDEPMVAGVPLRWFQWLQRQGDEDRPDARWVRRPITWLTWRAEVRRRGPYAPDFEEWCASRKRRE
jgi:hypothetical protein